MKVHNPNRYGETWSQDWINSQLGELENIKSWVILSGGWAWHFISPPHIEYKHIHDHKDIDIFVYPENVDNVIITLKDNGFDRIKTKYDNDSFFRYVKTDNGRKIVIDLFIKKVPFVSNNGWNVVEPNYLLSLYDTVHGSNHCIAVNKSIELIGKGQSPLNREELVTLPK